VKKVKKALLSLMALLIGAAALAAPSPSLVIYNQGWAIVREYREFVLKAGINEVRLTGIPGRLDEGSVKLRSLDGDIALLEYSFRHDLAHPSTLLDRYLGKKVQLISDRSVQEVELLSHRQGLIVKADDKILINPPGWLGLPLFEESAHEPTLDCLIEAGAMGRHLVELTYAAHGLLWDVNYTGILNEDSLDLDAWAIIRNDAGVSFPEAQVKLVAGELNQSGVRLMKAAAAVQEGDLFAYHTYTLARPVDLHEGEAKHVSLFSRKLPAQVRYSYEVGQREGVWAALELDSPSPLPAGGWRIFDGQSGELIGQGSLGHIPAGSQVSLPLGRAFDLTAKRVKLEENDRGWRKEETFQVILTNPKDEGIIVRVVDRFGGDWEVAECSLPYRRPEAHLLEIEVHLPPGQERHVTYRIISKQ
jgi:hypothetical protein